MSDQIMKSRKKKKRPINPKTKKSAKGTQQVLNPFIKLIMMFGILGTTIKGRVKRHQMESGVSGIARHSTCTLIFVFYLHSLSNLKSGVL